MQFAFAGRQIKNRRKMVRYASEKRGSITVEAALAVPIFLFAAVCLLWVFEIRGIQTTVRMAAHAAAKQTAEESHFVAGITECDVSKSSDTGSRRRKAGQDTDRRWQQGNSVREDQI